MKSAFKYFSKFVKKFDISPFSRGGIIKLIIYFTWGLNASMFMMKDMHVSQKFAGEQIIIEQRISNEEFVSDCISSEIITEKFLQPGSVYTHQLHITSFYHPYVFSNRAPPLS
jgi:hypothetical protein